MENDLCKAEELRNPDRIVRPPSIGPEDCSSDDCIEIKLWGDFEGAFSLQLWIEAHGEIPTPMAHSKPKTPANLLAGHLCVPLQYGPHYDSTWEATWRTYVGRTACCEPRN